MFRFINSGKQIHKRARFSCIKLNVLCIEAGFNPIRTGFGIKEHYRLITHCKPTLAHQQDEADRQFAGSVSFAVSGKAHDSGFKESLCISGSLEKGHFILSSNPCLMLSVWPRAFRRRTAETPLPFPENPHHRRLQ
ncbi:hypothetical protein [Cronobacter sakazakii]|uniref:hypothetical protein n=1 Tax=Cronobacter sakazakii TaxID=28141 RepID=UPI0030CA528F